MDSQYTDTPLNYFLYAHGPAAKPTLLLNWVFAAIVLAVCVIIASLLAVAILRKRPPADARDISREGDGLGWIGIGTTITVIALTGMTAFMLYTLNESAISPGKPALTITVTGYDWWWKVEYPDFETANEIHIPVGVPVLVKLKSADVIHAFWVPQLAGKTEMIPGMTNQQWLQADKPGVYRGQCTQFCGLQHAHMALEVVAEPLENFHAWETAQRTPAALQPPRAFMQGCASCHAVDGTAATGTHAPDLTHLESRRLIAAGLLTNTPEHLAEWVSHPQKWKPGCQMPDFPLTTEDADALTAYLVTLK